MKHVKVSVPVRGMRDLYQVKELENEEKKGFRPRQGNEGFV